MALHLWRRINAKARNKALKIVRERALMGIAKIRKREIAILAAELNIPTGRLIEYFNRLKLKNMGFEERCQVLVQTLSEMKELAIKTELEPKSLKQFVERNGIERALQEMRQRAQEVEAIQARQAAA